VNPIILPIRTESLANKREHWGAKAKRAKSQRGIAFLMMPKVQVPCVVTLTRIAPRKLDTDNLAISFKHVRDGIADRLGVDDGDGRVTWQYAQENGGKMLYAVRVEVI